jgi:diacylglycerol kinase
LDDEHADRGSSAVCCVVGVSVVVWSIALVALVPGARCYLE